MARTREVYERAIAQLPPAPEKRYWQRRAPFPSAPRTPIRSHPALLPLPPVSRNTSQLRTTLHNATQVHLPLDKVCPLRGARDGRRREGPRRVHRSAEAGPAQGVYVREAVDPGSEVRDQAAGARARAEASGAGDRDGAQGARARAVRWRWRWRWSLACFALVCVAVCVLCCAVCAVGPHDSDLQTPKQHRPKQTKVFDFYIDTELQLGNVDRCRALYERFLEWAPHNCGAWIKFAELERSLGETDRARAIFELAISQPLLDMPEKARERANPRETLLNKTALYVSRPVSAASVLA